MRADSGLPSPASHTAVFWSQHSALLDAATVVNALWLVYGPPEAALNVF